MKAIISALIAILALPAIVMAAPPPWANNGGNSGDDGGDGGSETPIVVIDPGHGGSDPGTTECSGLLEKDANLDISFRLQDLLEAAGYEVHLTRTDDSTLSNSDRYEFANSVGGDALVSVHLNGFSDHSVNGTEGFYSPKWKKDKAFTATVHQALADNLGVPDRGIDSFASGVLLKSEMPATLQEAVFLSNTTECQLLTDGTGNRQQEIAQALFLGIDNWFSP